MDEGIQPDRRAPLVRWCDPMACAVIALVGVQMVTACVRAGLVPGDAPETAGSLALRHLESAADPLTIVVAAALVVLGVLGQTPRAGGVSLLALLVCGMAVLLAVAAAAADAFRAGDAAGAVATVTGLALPALAVGVMAKAWRMERLTAAGRPAPRDGEGAVVSAATTDRELAGAEPRDEAALEAAPAWEPDAAAGAVWHSAGSAAAGAAAAQWGRPGEAGSWAPAIPPQSSELAEAPQEPQKPQQPQR